MIHYTTTIKKILGKSLENKGYELTHKDAIAWEYSKMENDVCLKVVAIRERYTNDYIQIRLYSSAYGQRDRTFCDFMKDIPEFFHYESQEEFEEVITKLTELTLTFGLPELEKMSQPTTDARPKPETERFLYEHHDELNIEFRKKYHMENMSNEEILNKISNSIQQMKRIKN